MDQQWREAYEIHGEELNYRFRHWYDEDGVLYVDDFKWNLPG